jgi:lambda family phage portal protein
VTGYVAADFSRDALRAYTPAARDANQDARGLNTIRARSRDLIRNNPIAAGAQGTASSHVVGTGLSLKPSISARMLGLSPEAARTWELSTQARFNLFAGSKHFDVSGVHNFYEQQQLVYLSHFESGDVFSLLVDLDRPAWPWSLAVQVIEADRCCNPAFVSDTGSIIQGVRVNPLGQREAFSFIDRHPGSSFAGASWRWVDAINKSTGRPNVLHLADLKRPGQVRGVPTLAPVIESLKQLGRYSEAELSAAVTTAAHIFFTKIDPDAFANTFNEQARATYLDNAKSWDGTIRPATSINLLPGEEIQSPVQQRPNVNFDPFVQAIGIQIGLALQIPKEVLFKHFESSYSAARAALLEAWRTFRIRRQWLSINYCQPVYEAWLDREVASQRIKAPGYLQDPFIRLAYCAAEWRGDAAGSISPRDEAQAAKTRIEIGLTSLQDEKLEYDGGDWHQTHRESVEENNARLNDGLLVATVAKAKAIDGSVIDPARTNDAS